MWLCPRLRASAAARSRPASPPLSRSVDLGRRRLGARAVVGLDPVGRADRGVEVDVGVAARRRSRRRRRLIDDDDHRPATASTDGRGDRVADDQAVAARSRRLRLLALRCRAWRSRSRSSSLRFAISRRAVYSALPVRSPRRRAPAPRAARPAARPAPPASPAPG